MEFLTGINYWPSSLGLHSWREFDENVVDKDFEFLSTFGINAIRVFPSWDVFQPIEDNACNSSFNLRVNETPIERLEFSSGLSNTAITNFKKLLDLAKKYELKVIVSLITGWMSGKKFMPSAIKHLNPITDARAVNFECKFIKDFISQTKDYKEIIAWELGNECNAMSLDSDEDLNELWLNAVSSTIRVADPTRPVYAGMHGLSASGKWKLQTLGSLTDVQTTHPYPIFTPYCSKDELTSMRSTLHAAAESAYYSSIAKTPCLIEEAGALGPMIANDEKQADYLEKSYVSGFASGTTGFLWWCSFDQDAFDFAPYDVFTVEQNLGIAKKNREPKPQLLKMQEISNFIKEVDSLPKPNVHATVILSNGVDEWKTAYGSYLLAVQSGFNVDFIYENQLLPDRDNYVLPCINSILGIPKLLLDDLTKKVENGANLLITYDGGMVGNFERLTGLSVLGRKEITNIKNDIETSVDLLLDATTATVLERDLNGNILLSVNDVGKGKVYFLNAPLECAYTDKNSPEETDLYSYYKRVIKSEEKLIINDKKVAVYKYGNDKAILINYSKNFKFNLSGVTVTKTINAKHDDGVLVLEKPYAYIEYKETV